MSNTQNISSNVQKNKGKLAFVISVDTEEEWDWNSDFPDKNFSVKNVARISKFHNFCQNLGIKPTYFVNHAVIDDKHACQTLENILDSGDCEFGTHLHPWCNPPYDGITNEEKSHVVNLPIDLVEKKLSVLTEKFNANFGIKPNSFRTGRWGINGDILKLLADYNYRVDSSIYPFYENSFFSCHGAPAKPYWPDFNNTNNIGKQRKIFELPITAGFSRTPFNKMSDIHKSIKKPPFKYFRPIGMLWHLNILRKIYLSPELTNTQNMITLINACIKEKHNIIHMYLHSSSLLPGANPFVSNTNEENRLYQRIGDVFLHLQKHFDIECHTVSSAAKKFNNV